MEILLKSGGAKYNVFTSAWIRRQGKLESHLFLLKRSLQTAWPLSLSDFWLTRLTLSTAFNSSLPDGMAWSPPSSLLKVLFVLVFGSFLSTFSGSACATCGTSELVVPMHLLLLTTLPSSSTERICRQKLSASMKLRNLDGGAPRFRSDTQKLYISASVGGKEPKPKNLQIFSTARTLFSKVAGALPWKHLPKGSTYQALQEHSCALMTDFALKWVQTTTQCFKVFCKMDSRSCVEIARIALNGEKIHMNHLLFASLRCGLAPSMLWLAVADVCKAVSIQCWRQILQGFRFSA